MNTNILAAKNNEVQFWGNKKAVHNKQFKQYSKKQAGLQLYST